MTRIIACGHCGGSHATVTEVRACAVEHPDTSNPSGADWGGGAGEWTLDDPAPGNEDPRRGDEGDAEVRRGHGVVPATSRRAPAPPPARSTRTAPAVAADALRGPAVLGRSVLVAPGQEAPGPWRATTRVVVPPDPSPELVERLHAAWLDRTPLVLELAGELPPPDPALTEPFWELAPDTELPGERLRFALTANVVDARVPSAARFEPWESALSLGAGPDGPADVTLPDGAPAWVDGGPLEPLGPDDADGYPVIPRVHLVAGRLAPLPPAAPTTAPLAPDQLAAVTHRRGPARIIAPAGSGKTRVLTERTRHLVRDRGVLPQVVSLVAYNRRAREEVQSRLDDVPGLDIRTLNSLALAIAGGTGPFRRAGTASTPTTIDEREARRILERIVPARRRRANTDPLEPWVDALSACRLGLRSPEDIEADYPDVSGFAEVLDRYRGELRRRGVLDFDEQVLAAIEVLLADPGARAGARAAVPVLLVDEFQDLTPAHVLLVRLLAGPAGEVFGVGDDDQTIYGYTGASPSWLVGFDHYFPGAQDHPLTVNYRCPPAVVHAARNLLSYNQHRVAKQIRPTPGRTACDGELQVQEPGDVNEALVAHVGGLLGDGATPADVAVLARVNAALLAPLVFLDHAGIPVRRPPGVDARLLERSGTSAALAWLRLASSPPRRLSADDLRLALRRPVRSLHPRIADWVTEQRSVTDLLGLANRVNNERDRDTITAFAADVDRLRGMAERGATTAELLDVLYDGIGLLTSASQLDRSQRTARRAAHADELQGLREVAVLHPEPSGFDRWLQDRLVDLSRRTADDGVTLATVHATKGQEWPHVVVHDVRRDLHPHHLADDVEEERRVFHVAITRGRDSVLVLAAQPRSPFLAELAQPRPPEAPWPRTPAAGRAADQHPATGGARRPDRDVTPAHEALRAWRLKLARQDKVPPYVVFNDATLDAIVTADPTDLAQLGRVKGIGPAKLDRYGDEILGVLAEFR